MMHEQPPPSLVRPTSVLLLVAALVGGLALWNTDRADSTGLRAPLSVLNGPPDGLTARQANSARPFGSIDPADARRAATNGDEQVAIAADQANYCLYVLVSSTGQGSQVCGALADAVGGKIAVTLTDSGPTPTVRVIGVVPDGVRSVTIATKRGATAQTVTDNVFVAHTDTTVRSVSFAQTGGMTTTPVIVEK